MSSVQQSNENQNAAVRNVAPTIVVGLGGTGKEVLLRLRRRFFERYNFFGFPTVGYLWIDTDTRNIDIDDKPLDHIMKQVMFKEEEKVDAQIQGDALVGYFKDPRNSKHIFSWLDTSLSSQGQVVNGAGQMRPLGRLAFFHHFVEIRDKLSKIANQVISKSALEELREKYGLTADPRILDIVIVCSVAGGTGSGMFLDMAFLSRQILNDSTREVDITGYILLPSAFSDGTGKESQKIYANGYAALKELEFYSLRKDLLYQDKENNIGTIQLDGQSRHDFVVDWENEQRIRGIIPDPIQPPPFNTCYLIDNETQKGGKVRPNDKSHLCDMMAENVFINFSNESFARRKDSIRSNLEQYLAQPLYYRYDDLHRTGGYTEIFAQRFSSFGFSKLTVPVDRIRRACGYRLALDLIDSWLKVFQASPIDIADRLNARELIQLKLRGSRGADDFIEELTRVGEQNFNSLIASEITNRQNIWKNQVKDKKPNLKQAIENFRQGFIRKNFDKTDTRKENWGQLVKTLEQNNDRFLQLVKGSFDQSKRRISDGTILSRIKAWLGDDTIRLPLAIEYLKGLNVILETYQENYQQELNRTKAQSRSVHQDIQTKLSLLDLEESGSIVWRGSMNILVDLICDQLRILFQCKMREYVLEKIIFSIENELKPYIGKEAIQKDKSGNDSPVREGLVLDLWNLQKELNAMRGKLQDRLTSYEKAETHQIFDILYKEGMFYDYYRIQDSQGSYPVDTKLDELESLILQNLECASPYDIRGQIEEFNLEKVVDKIDEFCYAQFQNLEVNADAMEVFHDIYKDKNSRKERLSRLVDNASVWMPQSSSAAGALKQISHNRQTKALLSYVEKNHGKYQEDYREIEDLIKAAGYLSPEMAPANRTDAFYIYTECAGIPLAYVHNIEAYRRAYMRLLSDQTPLHIDVRDEKFSDILVKSTEQSEKILRAKKCLLVGAILNVIKIYTPDQGKPNFTYFYTQDGIPRKKPLGEEILAIETLKRSDDLLNLIEERISHVKESIYIDQQNKCRLYAILNYYIYDNEQNGRHIGPYAKFYQKTSSGIIENYSPEHKIISEELTNVFQSLSDGDETVGEKILDQYYPNDKALDQFSEIVTVDNRRWRIFKENLLA